MPDYILTGATGGIGRALALRLAAQGSGRLFLLARDRARLDALAREVESLGGSAMPFVADLRDLSDTANVATALANMLEPGATLIHNAGLWPHRRELTRDGYEASYAVNFLAPIVLQHALRNANLARVLMIGAGLMVKGRVDPARTPTGADFGSIRTYCSTKLCGAVAMRQLAQDDATLDVAVMHPGVVATALGDRPGALGWLLRRVKRKWESPDTTAERIARVLERPRWSRAADAEWFVEDQPQPWPAVACDAVLDRFVADVLDGLRSAPAPANAIAQSSA